MPPFSTQATTNYIYKNRYARGMIDVGRKQHVLMSMLQKNVDPEDLTGNGLFYPIATANAPGTGNTIAVAQANCDSSSGSQFQAQMRLKYGVVQIGGPAIAASKNNEGAFIKIVTRETDSVQNQMLADHAFDIYRNGVGLRGQIAAIAGNLVTLVNPDDVRFFSLKTMVYAAQNADQTSPRVGSAKITNINRGSGQITFPVGSITALAVNDFLFCSVLGMEGFQALNPLVAPTATPFRGIDRTQDIELLSGSRLVNTVGNTEDNLLSLATTINAYGGLVTDGFLQPQIWSAVAKRMMSKVETFVPSEGTATYGFQYVTLQTSSGMVRLFSDPDALSTEGRLLNLDTIEIAAADEFIHATLEDGGGYALRMPSDDGIECRWASYVNLVARDTRNLGVTQTS